MTQSSSTKELRLRLPKLHPKQRLAFDTEATELLYGGATRGGKSFLVRYALIRWCYEIPGLQCDIYRLNYDDVVSNHMQGETSFPELLREWVDAKLVTITQTEVRFNFNGSRITLRHCSDDRAMLKGQGVACHVRVFEEAAQLKEEHMRRLRGWVTMSEEMKRRVPEKWKGRFPRIIYTSNPFGESAGYFRRNFVKAAPPMEVFSAPLEDGGHLRQYIPAKVEDNPSEDKEAVIRRISGIGDEALVDALLNENWDAPVGDFIRQWNESLHRVPDFEPPEWWFKWRSFDWGSADPFAVYWHTISDGTPVETPHGEILEFPRGSRITYREWYGCHPVDQKAGPEMSNVEIARGILERTPEETSGLTITDSFPFANRGGKLISQEFMEEGVPLTLGNTARIQGWKFWKDLMIGEKFKARDGSEVQVPGWYITRSCSYAAEYIPTLQRHKTKMEDAVEDGEATHSCDAIRVGLFTNPPIVDKPDSTPLPKWKDAGTMNVGEIAKKVIKQGQKKVGAGRTQHRGR